MQHKPQAALNLHMKLPAANSDAIVPRLPKAKIQHILARVTVLSRPSAKKYSATGGPLILVIAAEKPLINPAAMRPAVLFCMLISNFLPIKSSTASSIMPNKICKYAAGMAFKT